MSDDDKDSHIQMVEITIDYGFGSTFSDEDIAIYKYTLRYVIDEQGLNDAVGLERDLKIFAQIVHSITITAKRQFICNVERLKSR